MKRKNRKAKSVYKPIKEPFKETTTDTLGVQYQRYLADPERKIVVGGRTFYKVIQMVLFGINSIDALAILDNEMDLRVGDILIDENDKVYEIKGFAMFRLVDPTVSDLYLKVNHVALSGNIQEMGSYLAKCGH